MALSELNAVNQVLSALGEAPVSSIVSTDSYVEIISELLNETRRDLQTRGWSWNTNRFTLPIDGIYATSADSTANAAIPVPATITTLVHYTFHGGHSVECDLTIKDGNVYDRVARTDKFPGQELEVVGIEELEWDDLPERAKQYIAKVSARRAAERLLGETALSDRLKREEVESLIALEHAEDYDQPLNIKYGNYDGRLGTYRYSPIHGSQWL